jgi:hypothetical protein
MMLLFFYTWWHIFFPLAPSLGSSLPYWSTGLITQFLDLSQEVGLLGRVIGSSQGLYLNTGQHKHRKTGTHIKHPCPSRDSNPQSRPSSHRRLFMPQTARLLRRAAYIYIWQNTTLHLFKTSVFTFWNHKTRVHVCLFWRFKPACFTEMKCLCLTLLRNWNRLIFASQEFWRFEDSDCPCSQKLTPTLSLID